jgi:hypothetical protein
MAYVGPPKLVSEKPPQTLLVWLGHSHLAKKVVDPPPSGRNGWPNHSQEPWGAWAKPFFFKFF